MGVLAPDAVHQRNEIILAFAGKHPPLERQEELRGFLVLARGDIPVCQFEKLGCPFAFFPAQFVEYIASQLEPSRAHEGVAIRAKKRRVAFRRGKSLQQ